MVNCFFSHFYQVCISKRFFHSRSGHFTFGIDGTVSESSFGAYVCHRRPAGLHHHQRLLLRVVNSVSLSSDVCHWSVSLISDSYHRPGRKGIHTHAWQSVIGTKHTERPAYSSSFVSLFCRFHVVCALSKAIPVTSS